MTINISEENIASILRIEILAKEETSLKQLLSAALLATYFMLICWLNLSSNLKVGDTFSPKRRLPSADYTELHSRR
jgi:hypothetical protein